MKCALLAAAATFAGPPRAIAANRLCQAQSIVDALRTGDWLDALPSAACGHFADIFAGGVGVIAAGAAAPSGPGAAVVGLNVYRALAAGLKIACGGLLDGGAATLGVKLEERHQRNVEQDIVRDGKCLRLTRRFGQLKWSAVWCGGKPIKVTCPDVWYPDNMEAGAHEIRSRGTGCIRAHELINAVSDWHMYQGPRDFKMRGFRCTAVNVETGLHTTRYTCRSRGVTVRWNRT